MDAVEVVDTLEAIVENDNWTFASHVDIEDSLEGPVGSLQILHRPLGIASASLGHG